ncbi:MAG: endonuclease/exonuclease/phosphatase family protein [bacterium]|nr:endonuclease/exonuclease/phosphatase family protein [bacterium]
MKPAGRRLLGIAAAVLLGGSVPLAAQVESSTADSPAGTSQRDSLRVMVWNIQRGANEFDRGPEKALAVIRAAAPDVCLLQESYDIAGPRPLLGAWLAGELGWRQWQGKSTHLCVLTHLEIVEQRFHEVWHGVGARLRDAKGREFLAYSCWIDWREYVTYHLRDHPGATDEELLALESTKSKRLRQCRGLLAHLRKTAALTGDLPLLVGGDWNCPSHLDWTADTARVFRFRRALPLPVSLAMQEAGFVDTFRAVHPNPVQSPGITWTPLHRGTVNEPGTADRIDRLYSLPVKTGWALQPVAAHVLPKVYESDAIEQKDRVFPSDHGAVVIDFVWRR